MSRPWPFPGRTVPFPTARHCCPRVQFPKTRQVSSAPRLLSTSLRRPCPCPCPCPAPWSATTRFFSSSPCRPLYVTDDATIYALSSAPGKAGIAVIRVSGRACLDVYRALCPRARPLHPRHAAVRTLYDPSAPDDSAAVLDNTALVLYFPAPRTVTGEDVLELHVHGGPATVRAVLDALPRCAAPSAPIRYAEPGEFTRRAFLHDRLDLAQVEALGDTLDAETEQQRRVAVRGGSRSAQLSRTYEDWRAQLLAARAEIEALIDFSEDQHFDESPAALLGNVRGLVTELVARIRRYERAGGRGNLLRRGIRIALVGPANAGKSSLLNLVVGRAASIVSAEAGTTRDVVEARLDLCGYLCTFADTAGFRGGDVVDTAEVGAIEAEGILRARQTATEADVVIALAAVDVATGERPHLRYDEETLRLAAQAPQGLVVVNKVDLATQTVLDRLMDGLRNDPALQRADCDVPVVAVSCRAAATPTPTPNADADPGGLFTLVNNLVAAFAAMTQLPPEAEHLLGVSVRQQQLLEACRGHLADFLEEAAVGDDAANDDAVESSSSADPDIVLAAEHLRYAANCLARITGRGAASDMEEVLGVIFEK